MGLEEANSLIYTSTYSGKSLQIIAKTDIFEIGGF